MKKIPIKKTNRKVPLSRWVLDGDKKYIWYKDTFDIFNNADKLQGRRNPANDISKGLENPLRCVVGWKYGQAQGYMYPITKHQKGDWNEWHKDMEESMEVCQCGCHCSDFAYRGGVDCAMC